MTQNGESISEPLRLGKFLGVAVVLLGILAITIGPKLISLNTAGADDACHHCGRRGATDAGDARRSV